MTGETRKRLCLEFLQPWFRRLPAVLYNTKCDLCHSGGVAASGALPEVAERLIALKGCSTRFRPATTLLRLGKLRMLDVMHGPKIQLGRIR